MEKSKIIFGINLSHDTSCAALVNGEIKVAIEEERLNRFKHCDGKTPFGKIIPYLSINYCCDYLNISARDVDMWVVNACFSDAVVVAKQQLFGIDPDKIVQVELPGHHLTHAYSTFYASSYKEAAILVYDVNGGFNSLRKENYSIYYGIADGIAPVHLDFLQKGEISAAEMYMIYAAILQLSPKKDGEYGNDDALSSGGKLMGYASHYSSVKGNSRKLLERIKNNGLPDSVAVPSILETEDEHFVIQIEKAIDYLKSQGLVENENGTFNQIDMKNGKPAYHGIFGWDIKKYVQWKYRSSSLKEAKWMRLGAEGQALLEDSILKMAHAAHKKTGSKNLCVAGGTMLNMVACTKIIDQTPFENIFIQPAANDGGNAIGAAFYGYHQLLGNKKHFYLENEYQTYLGKPYSDEEIVKALNSDWLLSFDYTKYNNEDELIDDLAKILSQNQIVALFRGRSEFGPRALGNRSFLASPVLPDMLQRMNELKNRAWYRPVAPVLPEEEFETYFDAPFHKTPFMTLAATCRERTKLEAPAICHVDGSARPQTVSRSSNPFLHKLLYRFKSLTGIPVLINTSFNIQEPIVEIPEHAINTFLQSCQLIDCLALENYVIKNKAFMEDPECRHAHQVIK